MNDAIEQQKVMAQQVITHDDFGSVDTVAGVDVSNTRFDPQKMVYGAGVLFSFPKLEILQTVSKGERQDFPYIPGLLGFREAPVLVDVCSQFKVKPDLIFVDGQGISHPRRLGIACHLGIMLDIPTIGVAKTVLVGEPAGVLGEAVGSTVPLVWKGQVLGAFLRTKKRCAPLIISPGHRVSLETAVELVMKSVGRYRIPEPTRFAHHAANDCRKTLIINQIAV